MSHTPQPAPHRGGRSLARRVTAKLAALTATLAGVLALTLAPAGVATAQEPECRRLITVVSSFSILVGTEAEFEVARPPCVEVTVDFDFGD